MWKLCKAWPRLPEMALAMGLLAFSQEVAALDVRRASELTNLVRQDCGSCHGMTLKGGLGRPLTPESLKDSPVEGIARIILDGVQGTPMPPWSGLITEEEARWIAELLRQGLPQ